VRFNVLLETRYIHSNFARPCDQLLHRDDARVREHLVVQRPELSLRVGGERGFGSKNRLRMRFVQRELLEHQPHIIREQREYIVSLLRGDTAVRTLEIGELDDRHTRIRRPTKRRSRQRDIDRCVRQRFPPGLQFRRVAKQRTHLNSSFAGLKLRGCDGSKSAAVAAFRIFHTALRNLHRARA